MNSIIMAINKRDTSSPVGIWLMPFANRVCDTHYHNGVR